MSEVETVTILLDKRLLDRFLGWAEDHAEVINEVHTRGDRDDHPDMYEVLMPQ